MGLRGNLFVKIFLGFWLVTTAILGSWMISSIYFDSGLEEPHPSERQVLPHHAGPPHGIVLRTLYNLQHMPDAELLAMLDEVYQQRGISIFLLGRDAKDLFQREVPRAASNLAVRLHRGKRRATDKSMGRHLLAHRIYREHGGMMSAVFVFPPPPGGILRTLREHLWLRIILAVAISGLICFALSRLMTKRLKELGHASRRLAQGELNTRLVVRDYGGDETDELARDFNSMAAQLQERIGTQKQLLRDVSHELRSPLARLRVALALAQEDPTSLPTRLRRIEQEAERLDELVDQLLSTQADDITPDTHIDLVSLLQQLCTDAGFEGEVRALRVRFYSEVKEAIVPSSADLLRKSFENILRNALHHTADNTEITVNLRQQGQYFVITVEDHGPGVAPSALEHIFTEFYRVDTTRSRESGGYGLGLAIARRAILRHGGHISADNIDSGLQVTVSLPRDLDIADA